MIRISDREKGPMKPVHSVGQPPILGINDYSMFPFLKEIGVKYSRLHDVGGAFGKNIYVDIPNLFRDFDANPYDPASYDFAFTDLLLAALVENGIEPYFRLGVTIENSARIKAYRIFPPKDNLQWARICEGVIRHYTEGWGNGFHYQISHWEIWNEPENEKDPMENQMWRGTFDQYMDFYGCVSAYLKKRFPHLMIGGYGSCGFYAVSKSPGFMGNEHSRERVEHFRVSFLDFVRYAKEHHSPLDFFSFHFYDNVEYLKEQCAFVRRTLDEAGFEKTELSLNEWKPSRGALDTAEQAANIAAVLLVLQDSPVHDAELYDARCGMGAYSPLFDPVTHAKRKGYYALQAFNELYRRGTEVPLDGLPEGVYGAAAKGKTDAALMLSNISGKDVPLELDLNGRKAVSCRILDETCSLAEMPLPDVLKNNTVLLLVLK